MPSVDAESTPPAGAIRGLARILPFAGRDVYGLIAGMAISLISSALALGIPIALEALVDGPLRGDDPTLVWPAVGLIALLGLFEALFIYLRRVAIEDLAMFYNSFQSASSALEKISGFLEERPSVVEPANPAPFEASRGDIVATDVAFAYSAGNPVLPKFSLSISGGQTVALVGATGAGKSTLAKLIARFYDPTDGVMTLDGRDLSSIGDVDFRRAVTLVTQEAYLFSGSIADNIRLGKTDATDDEVMAAARAVGAHDFITALPDGYGTDVNKRGSRISAGQRQLVSFCRAFIANPRVLILDEATASLDIPSERLIQSALQKLLKDRTAIIIAHRLSTVAIADRVLVIDGGRIVEDGPTAELLKGSGRFATLHRAWRDSLA